MQLNAHSISYRYPDGGVQVFDRLSFRIGSPGFHALFGPSGVGKTTLARIISGAIHDFSGDLETSGVRRILYTYNLERLPGWSSVGDHLDWNTPENRNDLLQELIGTFGLQTCLGSRFSQISLGQQNRTNLARYLLQDFDLLVMDESLANVDEVTKEAIILKMKALFPDRGFVYISHNIAEVAKFCRDIVVLRGHHRDPQALSLEGQNFGAGRVLDKNRYERTMLEMVNAL